MLEDRAKGVVYIPVSRQLLDESNGWSDPVQFKFEKPHASAEPELIFRKLDIIKNDPPVVSFRSPVMAIIASTFEQAALAARELGLRGRSQWRYASRYGDLQGMTAEHIVVALPSLNGNRIRMELMDQLQYIEAKTGERAQRVWT